MMKNAYPITLTRDADYYIVYVPDFDINTEGHSLADAIEMARDAIGLCGITMEDEGQTLPAASPLSSVSGELVTLVDVDFDAYRRQNDMRTVRRNVSLPAWIDDAAKKAEVNVSAVLKQALINELHLEAR